MDQSSIGAEEGLNATQQYSAQVIYKVTAPFRCHRSPNQTGFIMLVSHGRHLFSEGTAFESLYHEQPRGELLTSNKSFVFLLLPRKGLSACYCTREARYQTWQLFNSIPA